MRKNSKAKHQRWDRSISVNIRNDTFFFDFSISGGIIMWDRPIRGLKNIDSTCFLGSSCPREYVSDSGRLSLWCIDQNPIDRRTSNSKLSSMWTNRSRCQCLFSGHFIDGSIESHNGMVLSSFPSSLYTDDRSISTLVQKNWITFKCSTVFYRVRFDASLGHRFRMGNQPDSIVLHDPIVTICPGNGDDWCSFSSLDRVSSLICRANLDLDRIRQASLHLLGTHDYRNFCKLDITNSEPTFVRRIDQIQIEPIDERDSDSG